MLPATVEAIVSGTLPKGNALSTARVAAVQAVKHTSDLFPLRREAGDTGIDVRFEAGDDHVRVVAVGAPTANVGADALAAVSVAALSIYDVCKGVDRSMTIETARVIESCGACHRVSDSESGGRVRRRHSRTQRRGPAGG